ncbi:MAG: LacI family DNA-binding transcriptional regulator [Alphaproteobacteria bacterium]|nr:MAG: LacI family DNA-binding transcriptional regulator [Alphaproteobacteria bacterium]
MGGRQITEGHRSPTLADVARRAGVSTATVSRCLNAPDRVIEPTRERVQAAIRELGYSPNFGARALAARRTMTIGAIIPTMENAIFARGIQAFQETLHGLGYMLLVASSSYSMELEEEQVGALVARGADGLLLIGQDRDMRVVDFLRRHAVPAVAAWTYDPEGPLPSVGFDNRAAMRALAAEVIALGHRRLGLISAHTAHNDRARGRVEGARDAVRAAGLGAAALTVVETAYGIETGAAALARIMAGDRPPTAVLCGNDVLAVGALIQARRTGIAVPDAVSITGFDDIDLASVAVPALTTVHVPHREMGRRAARMLVEMVEQGAPGEAVELATGIRRRESLAPPPAEG